MIKTEYLSFDYQDKTQALKDINIDLEKGEIIALIGGNGAGKSTLFLNLMGILKPTEGKVYYNNEILQYNKKFMHQYRQKVSMVFQDPDKQIFHSNVYDDVAFALRNIGLDESIITQRVEVALQKTGAMEFKDKPVHYLSYGQKKRVAISGIIALDSEVILFDEPTAELDPAMTKGIIDIIKALAKEGKKILVSSHDMDLIYSICDYGYILHYGEIIANGGIEDLFEQEEILLKASLSQPWLVKIHKRMGLPLFRNEENLFNYWSDTHGNCSNRN